MSSPHRRDFLKSSAAVAAAAVLGQSGRAEKASDNLHFALIGAGSQGSHICGRLLQVPNTKLTAVCDIFPPSIENLPKNIENLKRNIDVKSVADAHHYEDWNELLTKEKDLQGVVIALPEHTHKDAAVAALKAGKHVFCEKPMAYSLEQGREMLAAAKESGKTLQIGQQRRSSPLYYLAYRLLQKDGKIGEILRVDAFWDRAQDWKRAVPDVKKDFTPWGFPTTDHLVNWRLYRKYGHGLMTENGTHQMDASGWLLGNKKPLYVCGMGAIRYKDKRETHDIASAEYLYEGDTVVRFTQDFHQNLNYGWEYGELFLGSDAAIRVTEEQHLVFYPKRKDNKGYREGTEIKVSELGTIEFPGATYTADDLAKVADFRTFSYENEMRIFAHCVRNGGQPTCTGQIGFNSIVPTILGTEAQFGKKYVDFDAKMWV
jgi:predicted dehydrogenase